MITNPIKAIRAKCLDCCCGSIAEIRLCSCVDCSLHPFRFGKNPYRTRREYTEEERAALKARLSENHPNAAERKDLLSSVEGNHTPVLTITANCLDTAVRSART